MFTGIGIGLVYEVRFFISFLHCFVCDKDNYAFFSEVIFRNVVCVVGERVLSIEHR